MWNFLSFNHFITQDVLIVFYYLGAVLLPIVIYVFKDYLSEHVSFIKRINEKLHQIYSSFSSNEKFLFWILLVMVFFLMELFWRMMFEAMIGYFDIHEYLYKLTNLAN